jgi:hypothetical protein
MLEIYNKTYGVKELYTEELVSSLKVYEEKVRVLGGMIYFMIEEYSGKETTNPIENQSRSRDIEQNYGNSRR